MIDPLSLITIGAAIAAIISGFKSGKDLFHDWRIRRKVGNASSVESALETTPQAVRHDYSKGHSQFGRAFSVGDDVSRRSLIQILTRMNEQLIDVLKLVLTPTAALGDLHCAELCTAATSVRHDVRSCFVQFKQRLMAHAPMRRSLPLFTRPQQASHNEPRRSMDPGDSLPPSTWAPEPDYRTRRHAALGASAASSFASMLAEAPEPKSQRREFGQSWRVNVELSKVERGHARVDKLASALTASHGRSAASPIRSEHLTMSSDHILASNLQDLRASSTVTRRKDSHASQSPSSARRESSVRLNAPQSSQFRNQVDDWLENVGSGTPSVSSSPTTVIQPAAEILELPATTPRSANVQPSLPGTRPDSEMAANHVASFGEVSTTHRGPRSCGQDLHHGIRSPSPLQNSVNLTRGARSVKPRTSQTVPPSKQTPVAAPAVFCPSAVRLQQDARLSLVDGGYTCPRYGDMICSACGGRVATQPFQLLMSNTGSRCPSKWDVHTRFLAKCHVQSAGTASGSTGCVICRNGQRFRGRNELWKHLEGHSAEELEAEVDIVRVNSIA